MSADRYAWMSSALCAQVGGDEWTEGLAGAGSRTAKRICRACPVIASCTAHATALENYDGTPLRGVWGGRTHNQKRPRQLEEAA
ncbi:WhiB family transcriptional regulator [Streptomyces fungicidicus]|uniref:WhiB family transcriptional regulator n=1 Tax=Streptomyces fungicidicus TaxID=68203 RepID=UPI00380FFB9A